MIKANKRDYKDGFTKHFHSYRNFSKDEDKHPISICTKRLILVYCVECGLKFMIMEYNSIHIKEDAGDDIRKLLETHDFRELLKGAKCSGKYNFRPFKTDHNDEVKPVNFHEFCRYANKTSNIDEEKKASEYERQLDEVANWLYEQID